MGCTPMVFRRRVERRMRAGRTGLRQATRHHGTQTGADSPRACRVPLAVRLHPPGFFIESSTFEVRRSLRPRKTLSLREDAGPLLTSPHRHTSTAQRERVRYDVGRLGCVAGWTWETVSQHARRALGSNAVAGSDHVSGTAHGVPIDVQLELICCYQTERALRCGARNTFKIDLACC